MVGTGYVGLVTGACFAEVGNDVLCLDLDEKKIHTLESGGIPIYEPGLAEVVKRNVAAGRLHFTTDVARAVSFGTVQCIAVGTPPGEDGSADLQHVVAAARNIGRHMSEYKVVVDKSTVPVGTADKVRSAIAEELAKRGMKTPFAVVSNPEFLKEGAAVEDFMRPDRVVVGSETRAMQTMRTLRPSSAITSGSDGRALGRAHQVRGERMLATRISSERAALSPPARRQISRGAQGHRIDPCTAISVPRGAGLRRVLLSQGREGPDPHRGGGRGTLPVGSGAGECRAEPRAARKIMKRFPPGAASSGASRVRQHRRCARGAEPS
jgi:UDPglucose 6-dehydrogenase